MGWQSSVCRDEMHFVRRAGMYLCCVSNVCRGRCSIVSQEYLFVMLPWRVERTSVPTSNEFIIMNQLVVGLNVFIRSCASKNDFYNRPSAGTNGAFTLLTSQKHQHRSRLLLPFNTEQPLFSPQKT